MSVCKQWRENSDMERLIMECWNRENNSEGLRGALNGEMKAHGSLNSVTSAMTVHSHESQNPGRCPCMSLSTSGKHRKLFFGFPWGGVWRGTACVLSLGSPCVPWDSATRQGQAPFFALHRWADGSAQGSLCSHGHVSLAPCHLPIPCAGYYRKIPP